MIIATAAWLILVGFCGTLEPKYGVPIALVATVGYAKYLRDRRK